MGAFQTSLHNVPTTVGAMKFHSSARKDERLEFESCAPKAPNCGRTIGRHSLSEEYALVQQALAGDIYSRETLFAANTARLYRAAFAVLRNKEDAEDAVQDGLFNAYTKLKTFQGRSSFSTWLTRIVINAALMFRRRKGARLEASLDEILDNQEGRGTRGMVDKGPDPEKMCSVIEINGLVRKEIERLPLGVQRAFQLREVNGLSTKESIRTLGIRKGAFKSRILRARRKLTEALRRSLQAPVQMVSTYEPNSFNRGTNRRPKVDCVVPRTNTFRPVVPAQQQEIK